MTFKKIIHHAKNTKIVFNVSVFKLIMLRNFTKEHTHP